MISAMMLSNATNFDIISNANPVRMLENMDGYIDWKNIETDTGVSLNRYHIDG